MASSQKGAKCLRRGKGSMKNKTIAYFRKHPKKVHTRGTKRTKKGVPVGKSPLPNLDHCIKQAPTYYANLAAKLAALKASGAEIFRAV